MAILSLLGAVDSGKTSFFKLYCQKKIVELDNKTQKIRFQNTKIGADQFLIVDLPGHELQHGR